MIDDLKIRDYTDGDLERIVDLKWQMNLDEMAKASAAGHPLVLDVDPARNAARETVVRHIHTAQVDRGFMLIAAQAGEPVGYCALKVDEASTTIVPAHRTHAYVSGLVVDEAMRGHGIGLALLQAAESRARQLGLTRLLLQVSSSNPAARRLYERFGLVDLHVTMGKALAPEEKGEVP
ncbi:MAG: GNAT family N-acetyltransferase [Bosea sp. (in: a-proteobacteria)]